MANTTLDIFASKKERLVKKLEKLNRKCVKLGLSEMEIVWGEEYIAKKEIENKKYYFEKQIVSVTYPTLKLSEEWELIGKVEVLSDNINFVFPISDDDLSEYSNKHCVCEHCNKNMSRNKVFIIRDIVNKNKKVVGSTCLSDYLGHDVLSMLQYAESLEEAFTMCRESDEEPFLDGTNLDFLCNVTFGCIFSSNGRFYSKKSAEQNDGYATTFGVEDYISCVRNGALPESYPFEFETSEVMLFTTNVLEEMKLLSERSALSTFERNVVNCFNLGFVPTKMYSSIVGFVGSWWIKNNINEPKDFSPTLSEFIGKEGEKFEATIVVDKVIASNSDYGGVIIFGHVVGTNNKFAWYTTSSNNLYTYNNNVLKSVDGEFKIRATIKNLKPDEKFGNTTWITRAKIV